MDWDEEAWFREIVSRYEGAWTYGDRPSLVAFLSEVAARVGEPFEGAVAREALVALLLIEIEQGWTSRFRTGDPSAEELELQAFANRFPAILGPPGNWPDELIAWDYRFRSRFDPSVTAEDVLARFPGRESSLADRLRKVDRERPPRIPGHRLKRKLGKGGQGEVWLADSLSIPREVAVKILWTSDPARLDRLARELKAIGHLSDCEGVVKIHEARVDASPPHLVLEYVRGGDLQSRVISPRGSGSLDLPPPKIAARIVQKLAETVDQAHREPVVMFHRDLKPANVLLSGKLPNGSAVVSWDDLIPKLADFGMVLLRDPDKAVTETGQSVGSPPYMAPEQIKGLGLIDARTDVFGLGGILYFLILGKPPFPDIFRNPEDEVVFPPGRRRDDLRVICEMALRNDPGKRYQSAKDLADDLGRYIEDKDILARPSALIVRARKWARRHPARAMAVGFSLAMAVLMIFLLGREYYHARQTRLYAVAAAETLDSLVTGILADPELRAQVSLAYRNQKYNEAREVLDRFLKLEGDSPEDLRLAGRAGLVLTEINRESRLPDEALKASNRAESDFRGLVERHGSKIPADRLGLATALSLGGTNIAQFNDDLEGGLVKLREAKKILEEMGGSNDPEVINQRALCRNRIALCVGGAEAARLFLESIGDFDTLARLYPTNGDARLMAIRIRSNRAIILEEIGEPGAAAQHREAVDLARAGLAEVERIRVAGKDPHRRLSWEWSLREALAVVASNAGEFNVRQGEARAAVPSFETSIAECDRLTAHDPIVPKHPWNVAMAQTNLAIALTDLGAGSWDRAASLFEQAVSSYARLRSNGLNDREFLSYITKTHLYRGILQERQAMADGSSLEPAMKSFHAALDALGNNPLSPENSVMKIMAWLRRAEVQMAQCQWATADQSLNQAVAELDAIKDKSNDLIQVGYLLMEANLLRADLQSRTDCLTEATRLLVNIKEAIARLPKSDQQKAMGDAIRRRFAVLEAALHSQRARDQGLPEKERLASIEGALQAIERMKRRGDFRDPDRRAVLKNDPRFQPLCDQSRFRAVAD